MSEAKSMFDLSRAVGVILAAHFAFACSVKMHSGTPWQLLWFCHVSLALAAVGFLVKSNLLKATALTNVLVVHSLWSVDFVAGYTFGTFPFSFSEYVRGTDLTNWLVSIHHLYLLPLLLWSFWQERRYPYEAWLISATLFVLVMLASRSLVSPVENINYAYYVPDSVRLIGLSSLNELHGDIYLLGLHAVANVAAFLPAAVLLSVVAYFLRVAEQSSAEEIACPTSAA